MQRRHSGGVTGGNIHIGVVQRANLLFRAAFGGCGRARAKPGTTPGRQPDAGTRRACAV
jgi:hypothetical protein